MGCGVCYVIYPSMSCGISTIDTSLSFSLAHLGFFEVVQLVVESSNVAEYLWRNIGTNGVRQDLTGLLIRLEGTLDGNTHIQLCAIFIP